MQITSALRRARPAFPTAALVVAASAAALAAAAIVNQLLASRSERRRPPRGQVVEVGGVCVHHFEAGAGPPVVLIHGNGVTAEDFVVSGLFQRLATRHRVIAFDRPGFGYTARPRTRVWTAKAQAKLIAAALDQLGVRRATVVAHSWGTLVALRLALQRPDLVAGLGLISGYYWATPRLDAPMMSGPAIPVVGDIVRFTISPLLGWLMAPLAFKQVFSPAKVTETFKAEFPTSMSLRPGQIRAAAGDTAMMPLEALRLSKHYGELTGPILLIVGEGDRIASYRRQSVKLAHEIGCDLHTVKSAGHMVHHTAPEEVAHALEGLIAKAEDAPAGLAGAPPKGARRAPRLGVSTG